MCKPMMVFARQALRAFCMTKGYVRCQRVTVGDFGVLA